MQCPKVFCLIIISMIVLFSRPALSQSKYVAPDGAVGVNAAWEAGTRSSWYIEEQRFGADFIDLGIKREDPNLINQGLLIFNWGFSHQASDGSFPGTGDAFHSTSLFIEAVARATIQLKNYKFVYPNSAQTLINYAIAAYTQNLKLAASWLKDPNVASQGQQYNAPYTHRRYILAAALSEIAYLTGDGSIAVAADNYAVDGLSQQLGTGWLAAILPAVNGKIPPAVLVPPGGTLPAGTVKTISAVGVNPELNGYDISYQNAGILSAVRYYNTSSNSTLKTKIIQMINKALKWSSKLINVNGSIDTTGSTRVGIELNRDGTIKSVDTTAAAQAFGCSAKITANTSYTVVSNRISMAKSTVNTTAVSSTGAVGGNINWEAGTSTTWQIAYQQIASDWIEAGIACEKDAWIQKGILILDWGFSHQMSDGSFAGSSDIYISTARFLDAAARCAKLLANYKPVISTSYTSYYNSKGTSYIPKLAAAGSWLASSTNTAAILHYSGTSASDMFACAAALGEVGQLSGNLSIYNVAPTYINQGISLQNTSGAYLENGVVSINWYDRSAMYACRYAAVCDDAALYATLISSLQSAYNLSLQQIDSSGNVIGITNPDTKVITCALYSGYGLINDPRYMVVYNRMKLNPLP